MGDEIQAIKAGILEIADILVVNKADRPGVENTERALRNMLQLARPVQHPSVHHSILPSVDETISAPPEPITWQTPVLRSVATEGIGISQVAEEIAHHRKFLEESGGWTRREQARLGAELDALLQSTLVSRWKSSITPDKYQAVIQQVVERRLSPWRAVTILLDGDWR